MEKKGLVFCVFRAFVLHLSAGGGARAGLFTRYLSNGPGPPTPGEVALELGDLMPWGEFRGNLERGPAKGVMDAGRCCCCCLERFFVGKEPADLDGVANSLTGCRSLLGVEEWEDEVRPEARPIRAEGNLLTGTDEASLSDTYVNTYRCQLARARNNYTHCYCRRSTISILESRSKFTEVNRSCRLFNGCGMFGSR